MDTKDLEVIRSAVAALSPGDREAIAERSGVPISTLSKFAHGHVHVPLYTTVRAIEVALAAMAERAA